MPLFARSFLKWLPIGVAVALVLTIAYTFVQQSYRNDANDPQIMLAHEAQARLAAGATAADVVPTQTVDPSKDLAPFLIVLDKDRKLVASSMTLGGTSPVPPAGTLVAASAVDENRVTWQPRSDTRIAAVIVPVEGGAGGWVVAGRSLKVVEQREDWLTQMWGLGTVGTLVATFIAVMFAAWVKDRFEAQA